MNNPKYKIVSSIFISNKNTFSGLNQSGGMPSQKGGALDDISVVLNASEIHDSQTEDTRDVLDHVTRLISINNKRLNTNITNRILTEVQQEGPYYFTMPIPPANFQFRNGNLFDIYINENIHGVYINLSVKIAQKPVGERKGQKNQLLHFSSHKKIGNLHDEFNKPSEIGVDTDSEFITQEALDAAIQQKGEEEDTTKNNIHFRGILLPDRQSIYMCTINVRNNNGFTFFYPKFEYSDGQGPSLLQNIIIEEINKIYYEINLGISKYFIFKNDITTSENIKLKITKIQTFLLNSVEQGHAIRTALPKDIRITSRNLSFFPLKLQIDPNIQGNTMYPDTINFNNMLNNYNPDTIRTLLKKIGADFVTRPKHLIAHPNITYYHSLLAKYDLISELTIKYQAWLFIANYLVEYAILNPASIINYLGIIAPINLIDYRGTEECRNFVSFKATFQLNKEKQEEEQVSKALLEAVGKASSAKDKKDRESSLAKVTADR
jgi:hypothetical protein